MATPNAFASGVESPDALRSERKGIPRAYAGVSTKAVPLHHASPADDRQNGHGSTNDRRRIEGSPASGLRRRQRRVPQWARWPCRADIRSFKPRMRYGFDALTDYTTFCRDYSTTCSDTATHRVLAEGTDGNKESNTRRRCFSIQLRPRLLSNDEYIPGISHASWTA